VVIRRGEAWASNGPLRAGSPIVADDAALRRIVEAARRAGQDPPEVGLIGGDLCATLGGLGRIERLHGDEAVRAPVDVVRAELDGEPYWFVAHLVAHRPGWWGEAAVAMNAEWLGRWKLGPRAHPNDGLVDVTEGSLRWQDRLKARRRAPSGTHLPHPALRTRRAATLQLDLARPTPVRLDGTPVGRAGRIVLTVEPDSLVVVV